MYTPESPQSITEPPPLLPQYGHWEKVKDLIDQLLDLTLNYRQSGHPGGSRSKVYPFVALLLGGAMRWDIRQPARRFADRFVLGAGHVIPLIYCTLAVINEAMLLKFKQTGDPKYALQTSPENTMHWQDLLTFRHRGGLSGHAEMEGKTLFLKFNTGPSGHGSTAAVGEALALKRAGAAGVRVFFLEGEGGLTPGANYEAMNSAWGLALDNLYHIIDWNDFGIDDHPVSSVVYGKPADWYAAHGWRTFGVEQGEDWAAIHAMLLEMATQDNPERRPGMAWVKTRKGRGYLKYDNGSHGAPHKANCELFWETKRPFAEKYGVNFVNFGGCLPDDLQAQQAEFTANLQVVMDVLQNDQELVDYLADRLVELGNSIPDDLPEYQLGGGNPYRDERLFDFANYPSDLFMKPGAMAANRAALGKWGAWANAFGAKEYGRPLFIACSADLAGSTNISGFAEKYGDFPGYGWYERYGSPQGVLLPQEITEFLNAGLLAGMASVNFASNPETEFQGLWGACSTYGSFSYLKYGMFRLFSQLAQDCQWRVGKVIWVAGHSGPETAEDSRTHFGIYEPGVAKLFPQGAVIELHPWEYNEVPVLLGAALHQQSPIIMLNLTRPAIPVPDRRALDMPSHFEAARGAYVIRDYTPGQPRGGAIIIQGSSAMANIVNLLPEINRSGLNVKLICSTSPQLFALQPVEYRQQVISAADRVDSTVITTQARFLMSDWLFNKVAEEYALSTDWDNRWRTGGALEEVLEEAHLSPEWIMDGIRRFVQDRPQRLARLQTELAEAVATQ